MAISGQLFISLQQRNYHSILCCSIMCTHASGSSLTQLRIVVQMQDILQLLYSLPQNEKIRFNFENYVCELLTIPRTTSGATEAERGRFSRVDTPFIDSSDVYIYIYISETRYR